MIKSKIIAIIILCIIVFIFSCNSSGFIFKKRTKSNEFQEFLLQVLNDTTIYEIPALKIIDSKLYSILDTAISNTEKCEYFNDQIPYLHGFAINAKKESDTVIYSISSLKSIYNVIGQLMNFINDTEGSINVGVFYYKNYLFSVPLNPSLEHSKIGFPFCIDTGCSYRISAPGLINERAYSSYINFVKEGENYKITDNRICNSEILIR